MNVLKFERVDDTELFNLFIDGKLVKSKITLEQVLAVIASKESEQGNE